MKKIVVTSLIGCSALYVLSKLRKRELKSLGLPPALAMFSNLHKVRRSRKYGNLKVRI